MWNLIIEGKVTEQFGNKPDIHPSLLLVQGSASVGYLYDGTSFSEPPAMAAPTWQELRSNEYNLKTTGEQFDMLYHDLKSGTTTWVDWQDVIKELYPKES
tara:strand:- start:277 stop:576 length:300 start_codon:yes stop_codon:yes gene_type:complete